MKIAEFIKRENDLDVYDNVCEEIGIAFCGPLKLTAVGFLSVGINHRKGR